MQSEIINGFGNQQRRRQTVWDHTECVELEEQGPKVKS